MSVCVETSEVSELGRVSLEDSKRRIALIPPDLCLPFHQEARQLETDLVLIYRVAVLHVRKAGDDMDRVACIWKDMAMFCDETLKEISGLIEKHPDCDGDQYRDRILDLRNKCQRLQKMHS